MYYPNLDQVKTLASEGNTIPVYCEVLADMESPVSAYQKIAYDEKGQKLPYAFLLESVEGGKNIGRYSFLGAEPLALFRQNKDHAVIEKLDGTIVEEFQGSNCFSQLSEYLKQFKQVPVDGLAPFNGGAVGFAGYESIEQIETSVTAHPNDELKVDDAVFLITDTLIAFDRVNHKMQVISHVNLRDGQDVETAYAEATDKIDQILAKLNNTSIKQHLRSLPKIDDVTPASNTTKDEFYGMVKTAKDYIHEGDIIQVVLSQRFETDCTVEPLEVHRSLRSINPSPYMFCLQLGDDFALCGASPEIHARCENGEVTVRPIAGTRKRGTTVEKDNALAEELLADPKERAEHIMLVDLGRNDIGRIAETGSVKIEDLMVIERYSHVMHIVSNVKGQLKSDLTSDVSMSSTFPAGTVSGAPKVRAMQIISELEKCKRGPYAGTVAYFSFNGNIDSAITIRTVVLKDDKAYVQAGAGIVADSDPDLEYQETQNKARAILIALETAKQIQQD